MGLYLHLTMEVGSLTLTSSRTKSRGVLVRISAGLMASLTEDLHDFPQSSEENLSIRPLNWIMAASSFLHPAIERYMIQN